ncbi:MAG: dTDP-4-dehydrorhamnose reductase [Candidatus Portnoybacteria bacterium CG10_big_fil_rev_8_21_14_0_10_44_7]|uniref:dTDP-4-dehydrorhamnose reductase n=1 Tax=Candidatus Portnoybacteria bacterium CG10_big_fil_rev_8_21_14_0_10_44_7 TaxID=1974816 RepID=A0A2M8KJ10_9BACT|nr:MAG: dTDP-4-dehydrorhamnose reductase [Candidatus Portnoybacteria bacterium CG10_big_fil_rev_8_21_14_0_10_44_7]
MAKNKLLILGALGMLGGELQKVFRADKNYQVWAWDKNEIDIANQKDVATKIFKLKPGVIINAAAYNAVDKAEEPAEFALAKKINGQAPGWLAKVAKKIGAVLVHFSTDYVFAGRKKAGYKENDRPAPLSRYARTKLLGEQAVRQKGEKYYLIRLQKLFGRPAKSAGAKKSFFEVMLTLAKERQEFDMVDEELANFTYAPDLARRVKELLESDTPFGLYHITNEGQPVTWYGAAKKLFALAGVKGIKLNAVGPEKYPRPARRPKYSVLLNTKLPPLRPWEKALKEFLRTLKT